MKYFMLLVSFLLYFTAPAQFSMFLMQPRDTNSYDRVMSIHEFIEGMLIDSDEPFMVENAEVKFVRGIDDTSRYNGKIRNQIFKRGLWMENCSSHLKISNCEFAALNFVKSKDGVSSLFLDSCSFRSLRIMGDREFGWLHVNNCDIHDIISLDQNFEDVSIKNNTFTSPKKNFNLLRIGFMDYNHVSIANNTFPILDSSISLSLDNGSFKSVWLHKNTLNNLNLTGVTVEKVFFVDSCAIYGFVFVSDLSFNAELTNLPWFQIDSFRLSLARSYGSYIDPFEDFTYRAQSKEELANIYRFNDLISIYMKFYSMYKTRGDRQSANACYVEMKDIETRRFKYRYAQTPNINTWFDWRFNQFLKTFCDYGTNPVKSLIFSIYTILVFAGIYLLFYSDWDRINRKYLMRKHTEFLNFIRSERSMDEFYKLKHQEEFESFENYKLRLEDSKGKVPFFLRWLGKPLYLLSALKYHFTFWLYRRGAVLGGRWANMKLGRRLLHGFVIAVVVLTYLIYLLTVRCINSIVLSINTFSTLGFGRIPVTGVSRYIAVIEGFTGWFLLSIFSVSLISQMMGG